MIKDKKDSGDSDEYFSYTDPYRTKDLIWDAYFGFIEHYNKYRMFKSLKRTDRVALSGIVRFGVGFYGEIKDFVDKIYPKDNDVNVKRLNTLFSQERIILSDEDIQFLRDFFGKFMVDSGIKNVMYLKDTSNATEKLLKSRYSDIYERSNGENGKQK